ncbi:MAG: short-chain dehydrogenase, partial [Streptomyces sp.]
MPNITPASPLRDWLAEPTAGQVLRGLLVSQGQSEEALAPALGLPLEQLVQMSGGKFPAELVDVLVTAAETGQIPDSLPAAPSTEAAATAEPDPGVEIGAPEPWTEQVTPGRFGGQKVVVTGAASGIGKATTAHLRAQGHTVIGAYLDGTDISADLATPVGRGELVD